MPFNLNQAVYSHSVGLLPWPLPLAAAVARRDLYSDIRRAAPSLSRSGIVRGRQIVGVEATWYSPSGDDRGHLDRITGGALRAAADCGLTTAAIAQVLLARCEVPAAEARIEIRFYVDYPSPPGASLQPARPH
ncbi:hypothetical protein [Nocardia sp. CY41]|uniref:hypothetical protein n=1 Tax=Nocardia sp. CY41 TaxID=2608686 RepID=UPI00135BF326|nr:hypothetical protein [Nocardia sp. CY41]